MSDLARVELPSSYSRRAWLAVIPIMAIPYSVVVTQVLDRPTDWLHIALFVLVAVGVVVWAWRSRRHPALILDSEGVQSGRGESLIAWSDAAVIWVGQELPRWLPNGLRPPKLRVWAPASVAFASRTGLRSDPRLVRTLWTSMTLDEISGLIERFAKAQVVTGSQADLNRLSAQMQGKMERDST